MIPTLKNLETKLSCRNAVTTMSYTYTNKTLTWKRTI